MGALMIEYRKAPEFQRLSAGSKKVYQRAMDLIGFGYDAIPVADIKRRHVLRMRDDYQHRPAIANQVLKLWSILLGFAVDREYIVANPAIRPKHIKLGEHARWPNEAVEHALRVLPESQRRAIVLALYSGQRAGDCIKMRWSDYDGEAIQVVQQKTGIRLWIPCHAELRAELETWREDTKTLTILANSFGRPWRPAGFFGVMSRALRRHVEFEGLVFHGLRKTAAARLAEAGCSAHQIMAVTGHASLQMVQHYTRGADQRSRAEAAIQKLEDFRSDKRRKQGS